MTDALPHVAPGASAALLASTLAGAMPWQAAAIERTDNGLHLLIHGDPGVGKSFVYLRAIERRRLRGCPLPALMVVPPSLVRQMSREAMRFTPNLTVQTLTKRAHRPRPGVHLYIASLGLLSTRNALTEALAKLELGLFVLDECHTCKNPTAKRTGNLLTGPDAIALGARQRLFGSGTVLVNTARDLWAVASRLGCPDLTVIDASGTRRAMSLAAWDANFVVFGQRMFGGRQVSLPIGSKNLDRLRAGLEPRRIRVRKEDVLADLPPLRIQTLPLETSEVAMDLPPAEAATLLDLQRAVAAASSGTREYAEAIGELMGFLQSQEIAFSSYRRQVGLAKAPQAAEVVIERIEGGEPCALVFHHHRQVGDILCMGLADADIPHGRIDGSTPAATRDQHVQAFQAGRLRVLVLQTTSGGMGLNLQAAAWGLVVESPWTAADLQQAAARMHRKGQRRGVLVEIAAAEGSIDEIIAEIVGRKAAEALSLES